jgi:hypothetical protein
VVAHAAQQAAGDELVDALHARTITFSRSDTVAMLTSSSSWAPPPAGGQTSSGRTARVHHLLSRAFALAPLLHGKGCGVTRRGVRLGVGVGIRGMGLGALVVGWASGGLEWWGDATASSAQPWWVGTARAAGGAGCNATRGRLYCTPRGRHSSRELSPAVGFPGAEARAARTFRLLLPPLMAALALASLLLTSTCRQARARSNPSRCVMYERVGEARKAGGRAL